MKLPGKPLNEIVNLNEEDRKYLQGKHNWAIRMYFYLENGLNILNQFRNWFLALAALYVALKLDADAHGLLILSAIAFPSLILLIVAGRYNVHTLSRMKEWLSVRFSTHFGLKAFNYQEEQTQLLKEVLETQRQILSELKAQGDTFAARIPGARVKEISADTLKETLN